MTVTSEVRSVSYTDVGQTIFPITFRFLENAHLVVTITLAGASRTLALGVGYTATGAGGASGTLTLTAALIAGETLTIERIVPLTQPTSLRTVGKFSAGTHENALDRLTMAAQQIKDGAVGDMRDLAAQAASSAAAAAAAVAAAAVPGSATLVTATGSPTARTLGDWEAEGVKGRARGQAQETFRKLDLSVAHGALAVSPESSPTPYIGTEWVHPSVHFNAAGWNGYRWWMGITPYKDSDSQYENPSIYCSNDGRNWVTPPGVTNPLVARPTGGGYNADPDIVSGQDGRLYYFFVQRFPPISNAMLMSSIDGSTWSAPVQLFSTNGIAEQIASPGIVFDGATWTMFYVDALVGHKTIQKRTATSPAGPWSDPSTITITAAPASREYWHLSAIYYGGRTILLLLVDTINGAGSLGDLYLAWSDDGEATWTRGAAPVLAHSGSADLNANLYRASLVPVSDGYETKLAVWYSALGSNGLWKLGYSEVSLQSASAAVIAATFDVGEWNFMRLITGSRPGVADNFLRADTATALGIAPTVNSWVVSSGTLGISSRAAYAPGAGNNKSVIDSGISDARVGMKIDAAAASASYLVFRYTDDSNFFRLGGSTTAGSLALHRVVAGAVTVIAGSLASVPNGSLIEVVLAGSSITVLANGVTVWTGTDTFQQTATKHGIQIADTGTRISRFYVY